RGRAIDRPTDWLLAQRIWDVVLEFQPEALLDLHEGWGLREAGDRFPGGTLSVGQTIIVYPAGDAEDFARHVINVLNTHHNPFYGTAGLTYNFRMIGPPVDGSLARKAGNDLGIPAFIAEPTQGRAGRHQTTLAQRQHRHRVLVAEFLRWYGPIQRRRPGAGKQAAWRAGRSQPGGQAGSQADGLGSARQVRRRVTAPRPRVAPEEPASTRRVGAGPRRVACSRPPTSRLVRWSDQFAREPVRCLNTE